MKRWLLLITLTGLLALGAAACNSGGDGDEIAESALGDDSLPVDGEGQALGGADYEVSIRFDRERYEMTDAGVVVRLLGGYDAAAEVMSADSLPPSLYAVVNTDVEDFCDVVRVEFDDEVGSVSELSCGPVLEPGDSGSTSQAVCAPGFPDCNDMIVVDDGESDFDDGPPGTGENELPAAPPVARPSAAGQYTVTIRFNETVQQGDMDEVGARIRDFDPNAEYIIQESFPPTGVASVFAETEDFCLAIVPELESETFVTSVSCGPQVEPGDSNPDEAVSATPLP